jgi:Mg2+ and Co2+ transporter CorA
LPQQAPRQRRSWWAKHGYPVALGLMSSVCGYLYYRFRKAGWL